MAPSMQSALNATLLLVVLLLSVQLHTTTRRLQALVTSTQVIGSTASSLLSASGGTLMGSAISMTGGSATIESSSVLVNSPVSITAATLTASQCELQSDGSSVPLTVESGGSATNGDGSDLSQQRGR